MDKLLIVENDRESREALVDLLKADGRSIVTAENGKEALDRLIDGSLPRLVLLDLSMPVMDGWQFLRVLHASRALAHIPVIVVSGGVSEIPENAMDLIGKPIDVERLRALVGQYC